MIAKLTRYTLFLFLISILILGACRSGKKKAGGRGSARKSWEKSTKPTPKPETKPTPVEITTKEIEKVISTARSYTGTPHRDGGTGRLGIDCSALIQVSYQSVGLNLPRTSKEQSMVGKEIAINQIRPGDLVFFADKKIGNGITHVGLVTEVKGGEHIKFIHTSSKLGVTENLLSSTYFKSTFVKAVRPYQ